MNHCDASIRVELVPNAAAVMTEIGEIARRPILIGAMFFPQAGTIGTDHSSFARTYADVPRVLEMAALEQRDASDAMTLRHDADAGRIVRAQFATGERISRIVMGSDEVEASHQFALWHSNSQRAKAVLRQS